ncbi:hypothetical protein EGW08_002003 [Elysia chlorotica]|uniref:Uncharacterized protein n=1 Tax=Elysia chlorotica TaxID=188477 RepID=A0A3S1I191_ELYCH|nr:hypothetical protein EGW08_002003 [Elysia chlorotica]
MKIDGGLKDVNHVALDSVYNKDAHFKPESELKSGFPQSDDHQKDDLGQVLPPKLNLDEDRDVREKQNDRLEDHREEENPNDAQNGQILEPFLPHKDSKVDENNNDGDDREDGILADHDGLGGAGGGEEGLDKRNAREEEEERDAIARREEDELGAGPGADNHQNPLGLRQLEVPGRREVEADEEEMRDRGGPGAGAGVGQQLPPAIGDREGDSDKFGDNQYFGEADDDRQMAQEDEQQNNEGEEEEGEEEEDEEGELENADNQLEDEQGMNEGLDEADRPMAPFN